MTVVTFGTCTVRANRHGILISNVLDINSSHMECLFCLLALEGALTDLPLRSPPLVASVLYVIGNLAFLVTLISKVKKRSITPSTPTA